MALLIYLTRQVSLDAEEFRGGMISPTLTCGGGEIYRIEKRMKGFKTAILPVVKGSNDKLEDMLVMKYRIRKLTERECLRLMDVEEEDIDKMAAVNSATQMYRQAGNSIVVNVMVAMFSQMNIQGIRTWNDSIKVGFLDAKK